MVKPVSIKWGSYKEYEGPVYWGTQKHRLSASPAQDECILFVLTTTEGGAYDAYNGYDKCICTSGLIQWCDRAPYLLVTKLLGGLAAKDASLLDPVTDFIGKRGYCFAPTKDGWRFKGVKSGSVVSTVEQQQVLYLGGSSGKKGGWTEDQKRVAKEWAAALSTVWESKEAQQIQLAYTVKRLRGFAVPGAAEVVSAAEGYGNMYSLAFQAAYLSFAGNNPARAGKALKAAITEAPVAWTKDWLILALRHLTFDSGVVIYPHRYEKIRPVLERLYGVDLPDFSEELKKWKATNGFKGNLAPKDLQQGLLWLGFDLGPCGADGVIGKKTKAALLSFEKSVDVPEEHQDGVPDQHTLPALEKALGVTGKELGWY